MIIFSCVAVLLFVVSTCLIWYFKNYRCYKMGCLCKVTFQKFLDIYENAPHKIHLNYGHFYYSPEPFSFAFGFYFSIPDTFRYERWRKALERKEEGENAKCKIKEIEKAWQKDAEHYKEKEMKNGN